MPGVSRIWYAGRITSLVCRGSAGWRCCAVWWGLVAGIGAAAARPRGLVPARAGVLSPSVLSVARGWARRERGGFLIWVRVFLVSSVARGLLVY